MNPLAAVAARLGVTEGQAYTLCTGFLVAVSLLGLGLPSLGDVAADERAPATAAGRAVPPLPLPGGLAADAVAPPTEDVPPATVPEELAAPAPALPGPSPSSEPSALAPGPTSSPEPRPTSAPAPTTTSTTAAGSSRARIVEGRYASASGPLVPSGPPGAFLPVGMRLGMADKQSYLRLSGTGSTLRLGLSSEPGHQVAEPLAVKACRIVTSGWELEDGSPLAAAPEVDAVACRLGRRDGDGWTFPLDGIDRSNGVALVPSGPGTGSFQVTFTGPAV